MNVQKFTLFFLPIHVSFLFWVVVVFGFFWGALWGMEGFLVGIWGSCLFIWVLGFFGVSLCVYGDFLVGLFVYFLWWWLCLFPLSREMQ